jgi:hypothetical protein
MRLLLVIVISLGAAWGSFWVWGARALEQGVVRGLADLSAGDMMAEYDALAVRGFPNRFDLTLERPRLRSETLGFAWQAPFFQTLALSYRPNSVIAVWPHDQTLELGRSRFTLRSKDLRASVTLGVAANLPLDHMVLVGQELALVADNGGQADLANMRFATRPGLAAVNSHDIGFEIADLRFDRALRAQLGLPFDWAGGVDRLRVDATLVFDAPLDRFVMAGTQNAQIQAITLREASLRLGDVDFSANGALTVLSDGGLDGTLTLAARPWQSGRDLIVALGLVGPKDAAQFSRMMEVMVGLSPDPSAIELPLRLKDGVIRLGPLVLGPAPRLAPRVSVGR